MPELQDATSNQKAEIASIIETLQKQKLNAPHARHNLNSSSSTSSVKECSTSSSQQVKHQWPVSTRKTQIY